MSSSIKSIHIEHKTYDDVVKKFQLSQDNNGYFGDGLVFIGCGGSLQEWYDGILNMLKLEEIADDDDFNQPSYIVTDEGRIDFILPFKQPLTSTNIDFDKLALWRIRFGPCKWLSDYCVNTVEDPDETFNHI